MARLTQTKRRAKGASGPRPELMIALIVIGGFVLLVALGILISNRTVTGPAPSVTGDDIVTGNKLLAVHEMGSGPRIPFLPPGDPQPDVAVPESFHDFGRIGANDVVTRTFLVRNDGEAPLTISRAYTTCGCTTAEISADVIPPGKAVSVALRFDAGFHDAAGQTVRRGVILETNDPDQPQAEIWVQAEVADQ